MPRRTRRPAPLALALAALLVAVALGACQDYNFSPVQYCLIQPGTERVTLSDVSTADILFVVDDSGSMGGEQQKLADSFQAFVDNLKESNKDRVDVGLEPIDFHIAVTTTSVFLNKQTTASCSATCGGAAGKQVCCDVRSNQFLPVPRGCAALSATPADCSPGNACRDDCLSRHGENTCCSGPDQAPETAPQTCATLGAPCGELKTRYEVPVAPRLCTATTDCLRGPAGSTNPGAGYACSATCDGLAPISACCDATGKVWEDAVCAVGVGEKDHLYPRGRFVAKAGNPRVIHFEKSLFCTRVPDDSPDGFACACTGPGAPATCAPPVVDDAGIATLIGQFKQNIAVGTCGSGQEQGLEAARRAIQMALDGTQPKEADGSTPAWPHPREVVADPAVATSKLVVVFVGDEDDCSSPEDVTDGIIFTSSGNDACEADGSLPPEQQRRFKLQDYADFLTSLGRPVAGAFIVSAVGSPCGSPAACQALCGQDSCPSNCVDGDCRAAICCDGQCTGNAAVCTSSLCGGQGAGYRFIEISGLLAGRKADTVVGSVCNPGEGPISPPPAPPAPPFSSPGFSSILDRVAEVVKQPPGLELPTQPAAASLTLLRIAGGDGKTRKTCTGPARAGMTVAEARAENFDWWFTSGSDTDQDATGPSKFLFINHDTRNCEANPGETYSADYLGLVPAEGCLSDSDCVEALGGDPEDWSCDRSQGGALGTCLCGTAP